MKAGTFWLLCKSLVPSTESDIGQALRKDKLQEKGPVRDTDLPQVTAWRGRTQNPMNPHVLPAPVSPQSLGMRHCHPKKGQQGLYPLLLPRAWGQGHPILFLSSL